MTTPVNGWPGRYEVWFWDSLNEERSTSYYFDHAGDAGLCKVRLESDTVRGHVVDHLYEQVLP